jgi:2-polyprenyl-6-methoxyphenol hydroxylase-like FAD-dependent oxidoreductase
MRIENTPDRSAVVVGAGIAGLSMAQVLSTHFDQVTVLERDRLPDRPEVRRGVPQDRHVHGLLARGADALDALFPGLSDELVAAGAPAADWGERGRFYFNGHRYARGRLGREVISASRPFIETHVRRRVAGNRAVVIVDRCDVLDLVTTSDRRRVTGVRLRDRSGDGRETTLSADLVVDCSGRKSRAPSWLQTAGYQRPSVDELDVDLLYSTRQYWLPAGTLDGDVAVLIYPTRQVPRGGAMFRIEDDRWLVTLYGIAGECPPLSPDRHVPYAARLVGSDIHDAISAGEPLDDPVAYRFPTSRRVRYERMRRLPAGFLVAGDAVACFSPIYGQGMTVAALNATRLCDLLAEGAVPSPQTWFRAVADIVKTPWELAIGADLALPQIEGRRGLRIRLLNAYMARYHAAAADDAVLADQFGRVATLMDAPERLLHPRMLWRVFTRPRPTAARNARRAPSRVP